MSKAAGRSAKRSTAPAVIAPSPQRPLLRAFRAARHPAILVAAVLVAFSPCLDNGFVNFDDNVYLYENPIITDLTPGGIRTMFTGFYASNYHPLTALSNALEYRLWGLDPLPYHLNNLLLHALTAVLVFYLILQLVGSRTAAFMGALLFAVNPLRVESVAWASERKDLLYALFYCMGLIWYVRHSSRGWKAGSYGVLVLFFTLSLLSKSAAVVFPCALWVVDYLQKRPLLSRQSVLTKAPLLALSLVFGIVALRSQSSAGSDWTFAFSAFDRSVLALHSLGFYAGKTLLPFHLSVLHFFPVKEGGALPVWCYVSAAAVVLAGAMIIVSGRRYRWPVFVAAFYSVNLILVIQIVSVGQALVAERYAYLPAVGLALAASRGLAGVLTTKRFGGVAVAGGAVLALLWGALTWQRCHVWRDGVTLARDVTKKYPGHPFGYYFLGDALLEAGDAQGAAENLTRYLGHAPGHALAYQLRAVARGQLGDHRGALEDCRDAVRLDPSAAETYNNMGLTREKLGDAIGAESSYTASLQRNPGLAQAYRNRGMLRARAGRAQDAIVDFTRVIELRPSEAQSYSNRGIARAMAGDYRGSIDDFGRVLALDPRSNQGYYNRGLSRLNSGDTAGACADWERARGLGNPAAPAAIDGACR